MWNENTLPGTQIICIKNGPILQGWEDQPKLTVGILYTVKQTFIAHSSKGVGFHLEEIEVFKKEIDGKTFDIGYDSEWFRPLNDYVLKMEEEGNYLRNTLQGMPSPARIQQFEEIKSFFKAVRKLKRKEGD